MGLKSLSQSWPFSPASSFSFCLEGTTFEDDFLCSLTAMKRDRTLVIEWRAMIRDVAPKWAWT